MVLREELRLSSTDPDRLFGRPEGALIVLEVECSLSHRLACRE
jgi:hypothetical protein